MYGIDKNLISQFKEQTNPGLAEKDYIECLILDRLFAEPYFKENFLLAGGGTITKIYKIGSRIGQDIDLAYTDFEDLAMPHGIKKLNNFKDKFLKLVFNDLNIKVNLILKEIGDFSVITDHQMREIKNMHISRALPTLYINYTSQLNPDITGCIEMEFIPRHYTQNSVDYGYITPYSTGSQMDTKIPLVHYAQTFWDKVYALHTISNCGVMRGGLSHHYYDVATLAPNVELKNTQQMFHDIAEYQARYTTRKIEQPKSVHEIQLMPSNQALLSLSSDYKNLSNRFFGKPKSWPDVLKTITSLDTTIKTL